jgi:hypothetical protein
MRRSSFPIVVLVLMLAGACSRHDASESAEASRPESAGFSTDSLGTDEVRIVTVDSGVDLVLARDSISGGLSQKTLATVRQSVDTATVKSTGFAGSIEKMVKSSVSTAIGHRVAVPLSDVKDVRYEGGKLVFEWNGKPPRMFENAKENQKPVLESFRPEDARRFADAVRARKRAVGQPTLAQ